ncbi:MAG: proline dehydrogenase family protein [Acidobacteriota bacterium]
MAKNRHFIDFVSFAGRKSGMVNRFVAGSSLEETVPVVREFTEKGIRTTLDLLGEGISLPEEAREMTDRYIKALQDINDLGLASPVSLKLTQLGLEIDAELCRENLHSIMEKAVRLDNLVCIDMESSAVTQETLDLFREQLAEFGPEHVGIVIQAYLYRSEEDVRALCSPGCNIRLCKGAYMEPESVAFPAKADVDRNFKKLSELMLLSRGFSAIATHDEKMIRHVRKFADDHGIPNASFEFQMLYGVRRDLQFRLREEGYNVRVYVPFGTQWAPYYVRRLAERPANVVFMVKNMFR